MPDKTIAPAEAYIAKRKKRPSEGWTSGCARMSLEVS